ncbi:Tetratricopeptide repeat containing domain protein, related [Eimeria praecox]|uniref:peptidylprolyl isomerase n=1 Tax=Eimeria praecox TaxID=51316 RepID=U6G9U5_9EIME|nr:Tetratricopeptide repeat containing domain protein, related [Eimeria praecox]
MENDNKSANTTDSRMQCSSSSVAHDADDLHKSSGEPPLSSDEFPTSADSVREEGLRAFRAGDWRGATDAWSRGLRTLEYILAREEEFDEEKKSEFLAVCLWVTEGLTLFHGGFKMHRSYLLNLSLSTLKEGRWAACILYCDKALQRDPKAVKALYRKAQAQQELGDFDGALATLDRYLSVAPGSPLALSLQAQLRHLKAAHAVREKKLLQGMFRNLEHDPRSEAAEAAAAEATATKAGGLMGSVKASIKNWLSGLVSKQQLDSADCSPNTQNMEQDIAAVTAAMRAAGMDSNNEHESNQDAVAEAVAALLGGKGETGTANMKELKKLTALLNKYQAMHAGEASFMDRLRFRLSLAWFGIQHICASFCCKVCRKRQTQQQEQAEPEWEDMRPASASASCSPDSEIKENRGFLKGAQRRHQCRTAAANAARRRRHQQHFAKVTASSSRIEDLDEVSDREC